MMMTKMKNLRNHTVIVEIFDEEDWGELFRSDSWEPFEDDKGLMRVV